MRMNVNQIMNKILYFTFYCIDDNDKRENVFTLEYPIWKHILIIELSYVWIWLCSYAQWIRSLNCLTNRKHLIFKIFVNKVYSKAKFLMRKWTNAKAIKQYSPHNKIYYSFLILIQRIISIENDSNLSNSIFCYLYSLNVKLLWFCFFF